MSHAACRRMSAYTLPFLVLSFHWASGTWKTFWIRRNVWTWRRQRCRIALWVPTCRCTGRCAELRAPDSSNKSAPVCKYSVRCVTHRGSFRLPPVGDPTLVILLGWLKTFYSSGSADLLYSVAEEKRKQRWWSSGKTLDCRSRNCRFESHPRQKFISIASELSWFTQPIL